MKTFLVVIALTSLLLAAPAQACQLVCMTTGLRYQGHAIGGQAGGDAKCAAQFPGFKFARSRTIAMNLPGADSSITTRTSFHRSDDSVTTMADVGNIWSTLMSPTTNGAGSINAWAGQYIDSSGNVSCDQGTGPWSGNVGARGSTIYAPFSAPCGVSLPLLCCNI